MVGKTNTRPGFTIVELLIVIVVIGILAAISITAYSGIQQRAQTAKINSDLALFSRAIQAARVNSGDLALRFITGTTATAGSCMNKIAGTDLAALDQATDACWTVYKTTLQKISDASSINITHLVDPWGRPYSLDENEKEGVTLCGTGRDGLGVYTRPLTGIWGATNNISVPYVTPGC